MAAQDIIIKPLLSEKSYQGIQSKRYTFVVKKTANKTCLLYTSPSPRD